MILSCQNISKSYGTDVILDHVSFQMNHHEHLAIVGRNGCGKSTLLDIICGNLSADEGEAVFGKDITFGYLQQYQKDVINEPIYDYVLKAQSKLLLMEEQLRSLEEKMKHVTTEELDVIMDQYQTQLHLFELLNGNSYRSEVTGVLKGLGFTTEDLTKEMSMLSGGQKTRVSLARLLVKKPDILILDEPINHLDLKSIEWLEGYLSNYQGAMILVAHDRYFLDHTTDHVLDLQNHHARLYKGNYSQFISIKQEQLLANQRAITKQAKDIAHQKEVIAKLTQFHREKSMKRAASRQRMLERMELIDTIDENLSEMSLTFSPEQSSGNDVLTVNHLTKSFDNVLLFSDLNFEIHRGEHVAIIGDNGTGKTTIFKLIRDMIQPDEGTITLGVNVTVGYYDQAQMNLDEDKTIIMELSDTYPSLNQTKVRNVLAAFLFSNDDVFKQIKDLSGGERGRVSLAKLMLSGANFLILDEPTNHLDMESKEILEDAINQYEGTVLLVSHDRYFVNKTADRILELSNQTFCEYLGDYDYFLMKKEQFIAQQKEDFVLKDDQNEQSTEQDSKLSWEEQKKRVAEERKKKNLLVSIETSIEETEKKIARINDEFVKDEVVTNSARLNELSKEQNHLKKELEDLYAAWEQAMDERC